MDEIEDFVNIDTKVEHGIVIITFTTLENSITTLRILKFMKKLELLFNDLKDPRIKKFAMVFNCKTITLIPKEHILDIIKLLQKYRELFREKTKCTTVMVNSIIKVAFEMIMNQFYEPIKPMFICSSLEECEKYIFMDESSNDYINRRFKN